MFFDDAVEASKILDIALTARNKGESEPVPLCGVPYHACQPYIAKLLAAGKKVAICEQVEDPKLAKGIVRREVTRVVTPGMVFDDAVLEATKPNYLVAVSGEKEIAIAYLDISTGEFREGLLPSFETFLDELSKLDPKEILIPSSWGKIFKETLRRHFPNALIQESVQEGSSVVEALSHYVSFSQKTLPAHIMDVEPHEVNRFLILDEAAQKNLELIQTQDREKKGSLLHLVDEALTPMGGRKLRHWILYPLTNAEEIRARQNPLKQIIESYPLQEVLEKESQPLKVLNRSSIKLLKRSWRIRRFS